MSKKSDWNIVKMATAVTGLGVIGYLGYWWYRKYLGTYIVLEAKNGAVYMGGQKLTPDYMSTLIKDRYSGKLLIELNFSDYGEETMIAMGEIALVIGSSMPHDAYDVKMPDQAKVYMRQAYVFRGE